MGLVKYTLRDPRTSHLGIFIELGISRCRLEHDDHYIVIATNTTILSWLPMASCSPSWMVVHSIMPYPPKDGPRVIGKCVLVNWSVDSACTFLIPVNASFQCGRDVASCGSSRPIVSCQFITAAR